MKNRKLLQTSLAPAPSLGLALMALGGAASWPSPAQAAPQVLEQALGQALGAAPADALKQKLVAPSGNARPWVYWYFMDGNITREGIRADLEAMQKAGIGGCIYLEVNVGVPRGPVKYMSPEWQELFKFAVFEAKRLGMQIALGTGPGWTGSGGPWVKPELSMQHMVASETKVSGPARFDSVLERPKPRSPFFGDGTLNDSLRQKWREFYQDEVVLAFPTPEDAAKIDDADGKALYYRAPYTSAPGVPPRIPAPARFPDVPASQAFDQAKMVNLSSKLGADGRLRWEVPAGNWTILRFGRTATGSTTRPAPEPGLGFESDKFSVEAGADHMRSYADVLLKKLGPGYREGDAGLTYLHLDSWEMGAQNWTQGFGEEFQKRRGYDPTPYLPAMLGYVVGTREKTERFLWDLRQTSNDLILEKYMGFLKGYAHGKGLGFSTETYDMNPAADLDLSSVADVPMCEFWSKNLGHGGEFSCFEAVSVAHTNGRSIVGAESFTANPGEDWLQHPGSMKEQLDWALCNGINRIAFHTYQHQPTPGQLPGMTMGPYGVHWGVTQTWWDMAPAFHSYITRASDLLRQGTPVNDVLYLTPEGAPQVFTPPPSALQSGFPDRKGYSFDGCSPKTLLANARVQNGKVTFPGGAAYQLLVLPEWETMTPQLLKKIVAMVESGATIVGAPPQKSPSLSSYPASDAEVKALAAKLWGASPRAGARKVGRGRVFYARASQPQPFQDARWIWAAGGDPTRSAPVETLHFSTTIPLDSKRTVASASASFAADNSYRLFVNGREAGSGDDFRKANELDLKYLLRPGSNAIEVEAGNIGSGPNPAGLIGDITVRYTDGTQQVLATGRGWKVARAKGARGGAAEAVAELGKAGAAPWGPVSKDSSLYASYATTAEILAKSGVAPDFSAGAPMRFIHRKLADGDLYFVGNTGAGAVSTTATFRASGRAPEWWSPLTGESRALPNFKVEKGLTSIPLRLGAHESGFVVFRKPAAAPKTTARNFPAVSTAKALSQPWRVSFDTTRGGPGELTFAKLEDWSQSDDPRLKYYSGKAVYKSTFDAPAGKLAAGGKYLLSLGEVKNMASVKVNGRDLGVAWCAPWSVAIPSGVLKPTGNQIEITVANLWVNRLIGDETIPESQRWTKTTHRPWRADSPLQPSGLLGPVTLQKAQM